MRDECERSARKLLLTMEEGRNQRDAEYEMHTQKESNDKNTLDLKSDKKTKLKTKMDWEAEQIYEVEETNPK